MWGGVGKPKPVLVLPRVARHLPHPWYIMIGRVKMEWGKIRRGKRVSRVNQVVGLVGLG